MTFEIRHARAKPPPLDSRFRGMTEGAGGNDGGADGRNDGGRGGMTGEGRGGGHPPTRNEQLYYVGFRAGRFAPALKLT